MTRLLEIIEPSINHVRVLDDSYKLPNGQRALLFEMVEVRKETGRDDLSDLRVYLRTSSRRLLEANTNPVDHLAIMAKMAS